MSLITPNAQGGILVRDAEAELLGSADSTVRLFADASTTGGAVSAQRVTLTAGTDGASPHRHTGSAELFFVLGGRLQALAGDSVITADEGTSSSCRQDCRTPSPPNPTRAPTY